MEEDEISIKYKIAELNLQISNLVEFSKYDNQGKLENLAMMLKRGKSTKYGNSEIQIIKSGQARGHKEFDFSQKHFVVEGFVLDERKLEKGDI